LNNITKMSCLLLMLFFIFLYYADKNIKDSLDRQRLELILINTKLESKKAEIDTLKILVDSKTEIIDRVKQWEIERIEKNKKNNSTK